MSRLRGFGWNVRAPVTSLVSHEAWAIVHSGGGNLVVTDTRFVEEGLRFLIEVETEALGLSSSNVLE